MTSTSVETTTSGITTPVRRSPALLLSVVGVFTVLAGTLSILSLHVVEPTASGVDPVRRNISEYVYTELGWVFNYGVIAVAVGSLLIGTSLWVSGALRPLSGGSSALMAWSISLVVLVIFPKHDRTALVPSSNGTVHRIASLIAFVSVPIAAIAIARHRSGALRRPARLALVFGIISAGWLTVLLGGFVVGPITNKPWWQVLPLGLMERGMAFFAIAGLVGVGWLAGRASRKPAEPAPTAG